MAKRYHKHLYPTLLLSIILVLVLSPFVGNDAAGRILLTVLFLVVMVRALQILASSRRIFWTVVALAAAAGIGGTILIASRNLPGIGWNTTRHLVRGCYLSFFVLLIHVLIKSIFTGRRVSSDKIYAAISVYLMLGIFWSMLYSFAEELDPTAFGRVMPQWSGSYFELLYFSFCNLSTLGYEDLTPQTTLVRTLSYMEAIVGQLFVAVLIARLVGMNIAQMERDFIRELDEERK
jgi:hypothetical protein